MRYKDLFIDFDDTLYDTHGNAVIALSETFEYFHLDRYFEDPQVFYDAYWTANIELWTQYAKGEITRDYLIVERFKRPLMVSEKFRAEANSSLFTLHFSLKLSDKFLDFCASKPGVIDGAHELMDYLKQKGYRMHMCSNGFHEVQYKKLDACGLRNYFDTIILSEDAGVNKPAKAYFDYALKVSGACRETTLMIGDNLQSDILGALNANLDAMLFNRWQVPPEEFPQNLTFVVSDLSNIKTIL
jgi:putative hydrolase of the HAD superfamily